jgi:hypothetical protein
MKGAAVRKAGFSLTRLSLGALAASMLAAATLAAPAAGSTATSSICVSSGKCFAVSVSPASVTAGATTTFAFTITNEAATQQLGSAQISAPAGFVITGAPAPATVTPGSALFINLSLAPSASTTVMLTATPACSGGSYRWGIEAKQSNAFNGTGNDFQLDPASAANLSGSAAGSCSLAFTSDGQPTDTDVNAVITSAVDSTGGPVKVEILDGSGHLATGSTAPVTVAIGLNPGPGSLSGTLTVNASGGIAAFSDLSIDQPGVSYTLTAASPGITPTASGTFDILGSLQNCSGSCTVTSSTATTGVTVTTTSPIPAGDFLGVGIGGVNFGCTGTYQRVSAPVSFDVFSPAGAPLLTAQFTVSLDIDKSLVLASGRTGASQWQICYGSPQPFNAQSPTGTAVIGGVTYNTGLLLDCSSTQGAPCVQARHKDMAGDVIVTFLASGDPVGWG